MRYVTTAFLAVLTLAFTSEALAADKYMLDKAHTNVGFSVKHMVITSVKGSFHEFDGYIMFDETDATKISAKGTIRVASIDTGNDKRDDHLRSEEFFHAEKYPEITFESKRVYKLEDDDGYVMVGDITIRGVTKEIEVPFEIVGTVTDPMGNMRAGIHAQTKINRQDFGVSWSKALEAGGLIVGNDVTIELDIEAMKAKEE